MTRIKHRSVLLGLGLAALLVPALAVGVPPAAAAARSAASSCDTTPVFFGLHGMAEGPSPTIEKVSNLLTDLDHAQNNISGAVLTAPLSYVTVAFNLWDDLKQTPNSGPLTDAVQDGEDNLQSALVSYTKGCKTTQDRIVLVGYSMGAWVINQWLSDPKYRSEWSMIKGVLLYGDPCWINGSDEGLARGFGASGCMPASSYPAPVAGAAFKIPVEGWCANLDGVCGQNWHAKGNPVALADELSNAIGCTVLANCNHKQYWYAGASSSDLVEGAKLMVQWLGV